MTAHPDMKSLADAIARRRRILAPADALLAKAEDALDRAAVLASVPVQVEPAPVPGLSDYRAQLADLQGLADSFQSVPAQVAEQVREVDSLARRLSDGADQIERASAELERAWQSYELEEHLGALTDLIEVLRISARLAEALSAIVGRAEEVASATRLSLNQMIEAVQADLDRDALAARSIVADPGQELMRALERIVAASESMTALADAVTDRMQEASESVAAVVAALEESMLAKVTA